MHSYSAGFSGVVLAGFILSGTVYGQTTDSSPSASESVAFVSTVAPSAVVAPAVNQPAENASNLLGTTVDPSTLLPELPSLQSRKTSVIGGTIERMDRVKDQLTLRIFGGNKMKLYFDPRTHIFRNGTPASPSDLRTGDRVSIDTTLDGGTLFARNIRIAGAGSHESQGSVIGYRADRNELTMRDQLSPRPVKLRLTAQTRFTEQGQPASTRTLVPGMLVAVKFSAQKDALVADEVSILATPGDGLTFVGHVTALDLRAGLLVMTSATDGKTYDIYLDPSKVLVDEKLRQADDVTVLTRFDGARYVAENVTVN